MIVDDRSYGLPLLHHSRNYTTSVFRTIFQCSGCYVPVKASHGNTEQSTHSEELLEGVAETGAQFQDNEKKVIDDKWPSPSPSVGSNTEKDSTHGSEHEY